MAARRGAFVVLEGCDRCGKSTQCARLVSWLNEKGRQAELWKFPERSTKIGQLIDAYLKKQIELDDKAVHLLYSANRWELHTTLQSRLAAGVTVVCDRYAYSGVAFTSAKGLDLDWCKAPDAGLPAPDVLIHLELPVKDMEARGGFGDERYEVSEFQLKVKGQFKTLYDSLTSVKPTIMDVTGKSIEAVGDDISALVEEAFSSGKIGTNPNLW